MESFVDKATKDIPDTHKQTIGKLIIVNAGETEPARKIHYTSELISHIRSALVQMKNTQSEREFNDVAKELVLNIIKSKWDITRAQFVLNRMRALFEDEKRTKYDIQLYNDMALLQQCRNHWKLANKSYFSNPDAWQFSNEILADVHDILLEIALRWNLIIIPKEATFNINQMPNITHQIGYATPLDE